MNFDISCVINAHREEEMLIPTLVSVERAVEYATEVGLVCEILIVMDRANNSTKNVAKKCKLENVKTLEVDNGDLAISRNDGVAAAAGKYVAFVDGDDLWGRTWLVDAFIQAEETSEKSIFHPEFNMIFGCENSHVFQHVDMKEADFQKEEIYRANYWTALSFAEKSLYLAYPYKRNEIEKGFGYEDWSWNYQTMQAGIMHSVVRGTAHYIRKGKDNPSLLDYTNKMNSLPKIHTAYQSL